MSSTTYLTPKAGTIWLNIRTEPRVDPATDVGDLPEGARLELEEQGGDWHKCRVYVSTLIAQVADGDIVVLKPGGDFGNVRSARRTDPDTDVGDLKPGQRLELIEQVGDWLAVRVYLAAEFADLVTVDTGTGDASGTDSGSTLKAPRNSPISLAELQQLPFAPATQRVAPPGSSSAAGTAARIWNTYGGLIEPLANRIGVDPGVAVAVVAIESGGRGFGSDGRMIIRFEAHIFWSQWGQNNADVFNAHFRFSPTVTFQGHEYRTDPGQPWIAFHDQLQGGEWNAFTLARSLNDHAAKLSISMGLPQIMGFNFSTIGFDTVEDMFNSFSVDERIQLAGLFSFIRANPGRVTALQQNDFVTFAKLYNGLGQEKIYSQRMQGVLDGFRSLQPA